MRIPHLDGPRFDSLNGRYYGEGLPSSALGGVDRLLALALLRAMGRERAGALLRKKAKRLGRPKSRTSKR